MKTFTIILFTIFLNACGGSKTAASEQGKLTNYNVEEREMGYENVNIKYITHARGNFQKIILDNKSVSMQKGYESKPLTKTCSDKDWKALIALLKSSNLKELTQLEAPSKAHRYDGAAMANFTITLGRSVYDLKPFDAGNPHEKYANLVNKVIKIAETSN